MCVMFSHDSSEPPVSPVIAIDVALFYDHSSSMTRYWLFWQILKQALGMVAPDVEIDDGKGTIMISSEEGETEGKIWRNYLTAL